MTINSDKLLELKLAKLKALEQETRRGELLPHLYMHKHYKWSHEFENDLKTKTQVVCAANQIGKTSTLVKKLIRIATEPEKWPTMWPGLPKGMLPAQWWYLYPSADVASIEFEEKWRPLLPKVSKDDPRYGWRVIMRNQKVFGLMFNTGIHIYFKYYSQNVTMLQAASAYLVALDEECPVEMIPELQMRTRATDGFMFFVFTPTIGQKFWKDVVEARTVWQHARVWQPSLYDCMQYVDGSGSHWTPEKVQRAVDECISESEKQRRIFGKVVAENESSRAYSTFNPLEHAREATPVPNDWGIVVGVDYGSGAFPDGHPSAITFLAVNPDRTLGRVIRHWRGDGVETTAEDVVNKFEEMSKDIVNINTVVYDYSARDIGTIAHRRGLPFQNANKARDSGKMFVNSLFKKNALYIDLWGDAAEALRINPEHLQTHKLIEELMSLLEGEKKVHAKDDSIDSMRYPVAAVSWAWDEIHPESGYLSNSTRDYSKKKLTPREEWVRDFKKGLDQTDDMFGVEEELKFWRDQIEQH